MLEVKIGDNPLDVGLNICISKRKVILRKDDRKHLRTSLKRNCLVHL